MTIQWGGWSSCSGKSYRYGTESIWYTAGPVDSTTPSFTQMVYVYGQTNWNAYNDPGPLTVTLKVKDQTGAAVKTITGSLASPRNNQVYLGYFEYTYTYGDTEYGTSEKALNFYMDTTTKYANAACGTLTGWQYFDVMVPGRSYARLNDPTNVQSDYSNDHLINLSWEQSTDASTPVSNFTIIRHENLGGGWPGSVTTFTRNASPYADSLVMPNRAYYYEVQANGPGGSSYAVLSGITYTTPAMPTNVKASYSTDGSAIDVTWASTALTDAVITVSVEKSVNGGEWVEAVSNLPSSTRAWSDSSPPGSGTVAYRVIYNIYSQGLSSAPGVSNTVSVVTAPLAPTNLSPDDAVVDLTQPLTLTWRHNDGGDGSIQSAFSIRYSTDGGATWTALVTNVASAISSYTIPAGTLPNGSTYQWEVQTKGTAVAPFSPWSAPASFSAVDAPVVEITQPGEQTVDTPVQVAWTYSQPQGHVQTGWEVTLLGPDGSVLEQQVGNDANTNVLLSYSVLNGVTYTITVRAKSSDGVWSPLDSVETIPVFPIPPVPHISGEYDECSGVTSLLVWADDTSDAFPAQIDHVAVERSIDGGKTWRVVDDDLSVSNDLVQFYFEGFETDTGDWQADAPATISRSTEYPGEGEASLDIAWAANDGSGPQRAYVDLDTLTEGDEYTLILMATNSMTGSGTKVLIAGQEQNFSMPGFGEGGFGMSGFGGWQQVVIRFTAEAENSIEVQNIDPDAGEHTYIDRVAVYQGYIENYDDVRVPLLDTTPLTTGTNLYRAVSYSAQGSTTISSVISVEGRDGDPGDPLWVFLSYGDSFENILRLRGDTSIDETSDRARSSNPFAGRRLPVLLTGEQVSKVVGVAATLRWDERCPHDDDCRHDSPAEEWSQAAWDAEMVCYRDYTGRRLFGMLSDVKVSDLVLGMATVAFSVTQDDYDEVLSPLPAGGS